MSELVYPPSRISPYPNRFETSSSLSTSSTQSLLSLSLQLSPSLKWKG